MSYLLPTSGEILARSVRAGLWGVALTAASVSAVVWGADAWRDSPDTRRASHEAEAELDEQEHNLLRLEQDLGEACITLVNTYLPGGRLEDLAYEQGPEVVIHDLLQNASHPCGDNMTDVRINYSDISETTIAVEEAKDEAADHHKTEAEFKADDIARQADEDFDGSENGFLLGLGAGTAVGMYYGVRKRNDLLLKVELRKKDRT